MNIILEEEKSLEKGMTEFIDGVSEKKYITHGGSGMGWELTNTATTPYMQLSQDGKFEKCTKIFFKVMPMLPDPKGYKPNLVYDPTIFEFLEDFHKEEDDNYSLLCGKRCRFKFKFGTLRSSFKFELDKERDLHTEIFKKSNTYLDPICPPLLYTEIRDNEKTKEYVEWFNHEHINNIFGNNDKFQMGIIAMGYTTGYITMLQCLHNLENNSQYTELKKKKMEKNYKLMAAFRLIQLYDIGYMHDDYSLSNILINPTKQYLNNNRKRNYPGSDGDNEDNDLLLHVLLIDFGWTEKHNIESDMIKKQTNKDKLKKIISSNENLNVLDTNYKWLKELTGYPDIYDEVENTLNSIRIIVEKHNINEYNKLEKTHPTIVANIKKYNGSDRRDSTLRGGMKRRKRKRIKKTKKRTKKQRRVSIKRKKSKKKHL